MKPHKQVLSPHLGRALPVAGVVIALIVAAAGCSPTPSDVAHTGSTESSTSRAPTARASFGHNCSVQLELNATKRKAVAFGNTSCADAEAIAAVVTNTSVDDSPRVITAAGRSRNCTSREGAHSIYGCTDIANADNWIDWLTSP